MKILFALTVLFCLISNVGAQITIQPKTKTFKKDVFDMSITRAVKPNVMAYQYVLIKDGKVVTEGADGKARIGTDGDLDMTTSTPQNIGSLAKFLSGTAMISLLEKPSVNADSVYKNNNLQANLDRLVWEEFPKVWLDLIPAASEKGPNQRNITFRQLLQHRSGFDEVWKKEKSLKTFALQLENQFNPALYNTRRYTNMNFTLGGYLLPLIERDKLNNELDTAAGKLKPIENEKYVRDLLGNRMDGVMRDRIWNKMSPKGNFNCDAKNVLKDTAAYDYPNKNANGGGVIFSAHEANGHCVGVGGYYTSARDFANYVAHFSQTDLIVTQAGRDAMYKEGMKLDDRLVWTIATPDPWIKTNFNKSAVAWSNGIAGGNRTILLQLPDNYYLILFTTSPEMDVESLFNTGMTAFKESMKHNF